MAKGPGQNRGEEVGVRIDHAPDVDRIEEIGIVTMGERRDETEIE